MSSKLKIVLLAAFAALSIGFMQPADTIATVNGDPISVAMFQQRIRFARWTSAQQLTQILQSYGENALTDPNSPFNAQYKLLTDSAGLGPQGLHSLIAIKLGKQEAAPRNTSVSGDDGQPQIYQVFGHATDAAAAPAVPGKKPPAA